MIGAGAIEARSVEVWWGWGVLSDWRVTLGSTAQTTDIPQRILLC
jgi:hypothetical protein